MSGCAPCPPLADVRVVGGDGGLVAIVRAELAAIQGELALGVCVDHVHLDARVGPDRNGTYDPITRGVRLAARDDPDEVTRTLRHEVCHAIDLQNGVVAGSEALYPYEDPPEIRDAHLVNEAFADVCELGAEALTAVGVDGCGGDPDLRAVDHVREVVFGGGVPMGAGAVYQPVATYEGYWTMEDPVYSIQFRRGSERGRLLLDVLHSAPPLILRDEVDVWTGAPTDRTYSAAGNEAPNTDAAPPGWSVEVGGPLRADVPDGDVVAWSELWLPTGRVDRALARVDGVWGPATGPCPNDTTAFFTFDGELWSGQYADGALSWGRWARSPQP